MSATIFTGVLLPREASAQENRPGVIERDAPAAEGEEEADDEAPAVPARPATPPAGQPTPGRGETVITPDNVSPDERFNLPANFDPNYRPKRTPRNTRVTLDFRQAQLAEVVKFFAAAMNKNFIIADNLQANKTITIISPEEVSLAEAYRAFVAALEMNGLTLVPFGQFTKIIDSKKAISEPSPTYGEGERLPNLQRMVTAIVPVENSTPEEMQGIISKFVSSSATIIPYGSSLIITENASNLTRIRDLIKRLDLDEGQEQVYVYEVQYAEAADVQAKLTEIFGAGEPGQTAAQRKAAAAQKSGSPGEISAQISQILADERTNKLIIMANPRDFGQIKSMIELLDVPTAVGGQVHVKFLEYAAAEEIATALSGLTSGRNTSQAPARGRRAAAPAATNQVAALLDGDVQITAYTPNNALIVTAAPKDYVALESVIDRLDRPRKQVYVEAVILEIAMDTDSKMGLGVSAVGGQDYSSIIPQSAVDSGLIDNTQGAVIGQSNFKAESLLGGALGGTIGLLGPFATIPGTEISLPAFALTLMATQTDSAVNLLSAPAIMTMDNEEAEIVVADRVPFVTGIASGLSSLAGLAGGATGAGALSALGGLISPVQYEDVGITLRILPQINESSYVRLEIDQEVSDLKGASTESNPTPTRTKRSIKTVVLVEDQSTVVLGGLMRESETKTITKVPFLGDIPLLGFLFRDTGTRKVKQNLVLMLTPYIIENKADIQKIYDRKMEERKELSKLLKIDSKDYIRNVNFQKKTGLVDRMRSTLREAQLDAAAREAAAAAFDNKGPRYQILGAESQPGAASETDGTAKPATDASPGTLEQP